MPETQYPLMSYKRPGTNILSNLTISETGAIRIPFGASNERPPTGQPGMIRYNTETDTIEYYNNSLNIWGDISEPTPEITSISPVILLDPSAGQTQTFTITGNNFLSGCFVEFIGKDSTSIYGDDQTNFFSGNSIEAVFNYNNSIYDSSFNEPFSVRITNPSGRNYTLTDVVVYDARPVFTNVANLGSIDSSQNVSGLLADLTGTDPDSHYPLTFDVSNGSTLPGTIEISNNTLVGNGTGVFIGYSPIISSASTTYSPYFVITDASNNPSFFERFNFTVRGPLNLRTSTAITSGGTIDISFTDSTGTNYINDPSYGGYTIYTFKASNNTTNALFTFHPNNWTDIGEILIVGGGGGGGSCAAGGGAGGFVNENFYFQNGSTYDIQVGGGGTGGASGGDNAGANGGTSFIGRLTYKLNAFGGGGGAALQSTIGGYGGSGGGGGYNIDQGGKSKGSSGTTLTLLQGHDGGDGNDELGGGNFPGGGGGGAGGPGGFVTSSSQGPNGGVGLFSSITGVNTGYAGGGGASTIAGGTAGFGGGGSSNPYGAADGRANTQTVGNSALPHRGSGGGAGSSTGTSPATRSGGGAGGSGIVVIKIPSYPLNLGENRLALSNTSLTYDISYVDNGGSYTSSPQIDGETIYTFKQGSGTITPNFSYDCSYLVVAGGGGGGTSQIEDRGAGGGGAGGLKFGVIPVANNLAFTLQIGAGGLGGQYQVNNGTITGNGTNGGNSIINGITTIGGGYGAGVFGNPPGGDGGSGGGGRNGGGGGSGVSGEGNSGGGSTGGGGGGGGYGSTGSAGSTVLGGNGGSGYASSITGSSITYAAGGGGGGSGAGNSGGSSSGGGSGASGYASSGAINNSIAGIPNPSTGSGGGGGSSQTTNTGKRGNSGSNGANGAVILRFPSFSSPISLNALSISATNGTADIIYVNSSNSVVNSPVSGGYTIYSFTCTSNLTTATFTVQPNTSISNIHYLVVAGGGGGGSLQPATNNVCGGGGGAGGYNTSIGSSAISFTQSYYYLTVGGGGAIDSNGANSEIYGTGITTITSLGGGAGGSTNDNGSNGGSGGGAGAPTGTSFGSGSGTQGGNGGSEDSRTGGGGGGAGGDGGDASGGDGAPGGVGVQNNITGINTYYAGGGGSGTPVGANQNNSGGLGGGGRGGIQTDTASERNGVSGEPGTGGGGGSSADPGGTNSAPVSGTGGSGIIVLRIPSFA